MTLATGSFQLSRKFTLTPERLWHWLTDPEARSAWSAPSDNDVLVMDVSDLREDGADLQRCGPGDDPEYTVATRWYRLDAPAMACFTETVEAKGARIATSLISYGLVATEAGCTLEVDVTVHSFVGEDITGDFSAGWTSALDRLQHII